ALMKIAAEYHQGELRQYPPSRTEPDKSVLKTRTGNLTTIDRRSPYQVQTLSFVEQNVSWLEPIALELGGRKIHLEDTTSVDPIFKHVGNAQVWPHVWTGVVPWRTLATELHFTDFFYRSPNPPVGKWAKILHAANASFRSRTMVPSSLPNTWDAF